jgi:predicted Zn-dependent peptidase
MKVTQHPQFPLSFYEKVLPNGMKVVLVPRREFQTIETILQVNFAAKHEMNAIHTPLGWQTLPQGTGHFLEHRIFESKGEQMFRYFSEHGATINAQTSLTSTQYYFSTIRDFPELLTTFLNFIQHYDENEDGVTKEAGIILREFVRRYESQDAKMSQMMIDKTFPNHHLSKEILGKESTIQAITKDHLTLAHRQYYCPSNLTLTIVGNIDVESTLKLIENIEHSISNVQPYPGDLFIEDTSISGRHTYHEASFAISVPEDHFYLKLMPTRKEDGFVNNYRESLLFNIVRKMLLNTNSPLYISWNKAGLLESSLTGGVYILEGSYWVLIYEAHTKQPQAFYEEVKKMFTHPWNDAVMKPIFEDIKKLLLGSSYKEINSLSGLASSIVENAALNQPFLISLSVIPSITYEEVKAHYQSIRLFDLDFFHLVPKPKP